MDVGQSSDPAPSDSDRVFALRLPSRVKAQAMSLYCDNAGTPEVGDSFTKAWLLPANVASDHEAHEAHEAHGLARNER